MMKAENLRSKAGEAVVSTRRLNVTFETAVSHPYFNRGLWIVVEMYDTGAEAEAGHDRWVSKLTARVPFVLTHIGEVDEGAQTVFPRVEVLPAGVTAFAPQA